MDSGLSVEWIDGEREPQCAPDPRYPTGKDLDASRGEQDTCTTALPYPAKRCGIYVIRCAACGFSVGVTTAGRPDDPRSVKIPCLNRRCCNERP